MKAINLILFICLFVSTSILHSSSGKLPLDKSSSLKKNNDNKKMINSDGALKKNKELKDKAIKKPINLKKEEKINPELKNELLALEKEFQIDKTELRNRYKERRKAIYKKYGVNPPKKNRDDSKPAKNLKLKNSNN